MESRNLVPVVAIILVFTQFFSKSCISYPLTRKSTSTYQGVINANFRKILCTYYVDNSVAKHFCQLRCVFEKKSNSLHKLKNVSLIVFLKLFCEVYCFWTGVSIFFYTWSTRWYRKFCLWQFYFRLSKIVLTKPSWVLMVNASKHFMKHL